MSENNQIQEISSLIEGTYLSEEIFNSNRSRNVGAFYFAPTSLYFSIDLFMQAYGKPQ